MPLPVISIKKYLHLEMKILVQPDGFAFRGTNGDLPRFARWETERR